MITRRFEIPVVQIEEDAKKIFLFGNFLLKPKKNCSFKRTMFYLLNMK